jgi:hypothetical protein
MIQYKLFSKTSAIAMLLALHPLQILNADTNCGRLWPLICQKSTYTSKKVECADFSARSYNWVATTCITDVSTPGGMDRIVPDGILKCVRTRETCTYYCNNKNELQGPFYDSWEIINSCSKFKSDGPCEIVNQSTNPKLLKIAAVVAATVSN